jgi:hypothetical protein
MIFRTQNPINLATEQVAASPTSGCEHKVKPLRPVCQLAEQYCSNWCHGGVCEGADIDPKTGRHFRWRTIGGFCLLALGGRCSYFESVVLPMGKRKEWPTPVQGEAFRKAARLYHLTFPETVVVEPETRKCPDCGKHRIEARKRCCEPCRIRRRRATEILKKRKWRNKGGGCPPVKEISSALVADPQGINSEFRCGLSAQPEIDPLTVLRKTHES